MRNRLLAGVLDKKLTCIAEKSGISAVKEIAVALHLVSAAGNGEERIKAEKNVIELINSLNLNERPEEAITLLGLGFFFDLGMRLALFSCKVIANNAEERVIVTDQEGN
jgi:hypothetical protein